MDRQRLDTINFRGICFNVDDYEKFNEGIKLIKESLFDKGATLFVSDNVITWNKNYSFAREQFFLELLNGTDANEIEKSILWRTYILLYFAHFASNSLGDFVELGCHKGHTAHQVLKKLDLGRLQKKYYLYDIFYWDEDSDHPRAYGHSGQDMFEEVVNRFRDYDCVRIINGKVPDSFEQGFPDQISFCHIDMNNAAPEEAALKAVLPRLQSGGVVLLDDYGWWGYSQQKIALDPVAKSFDFEILELPTGQGLIMKV